MVEKRPILVRAPSGAPVIAIVGWKNSGKTTLAERLIEEFTRRGLKVASIKHAHHSFDIDRAGTDSDRHRKAGAGEVVVISRQRWAMIGELRDAPEPPLREVLGWFGPADLILVEGFKTEPLPKIEVRRKAVAGEALLAADDPNVLAIAADYAAEGHGRPVLPLDDVGKVADFISVVAGLPDRSTSRGDSSP